MDEHIWFLPLQAFVAIVSNCSKGAVTSVIQGKMLKVSIIYTDGWSAGLILNGYDHCAFNVVRADLLGGKVM